MYVMVSVPGFVCISMCTHGMHDFIMDSLKEDLADKVPFDRVWKGRRGPSFVDTCRKREFQVRYRP